MWPSPADMRTSVTIMPGSSRKVSRTLTRTPSKICMSLASRPFLSVVPRVNRFPPIAKTRRTRNGIFWKSSVVSFVRCDPTSCQWRMWRGSGPSGRGRVFSEFLDTLTTSGYTVWEHVVDCAAYGVPQTRKRLVVLASRVGPIKLVQPTHEPPNQVTVRETIAHLPPIPAGGRDPKDPLHCASGLSETNFARIRASKPGESWKDWDPALLVECHRRHTGRWYGSVYGRMSWDTPAPTITTQCNGFGNGRFGHPEQDRAMSLREAALLQTFPMSYEFLPPGQRCVIAPTARWIGNAVPVSLGRAVARSVRRTLAENGYA